MRYLFNILIVSFGFAVASLALGQDEISPLRTDPFADDDVPANADDLQADELLDDAVDEEDFRRRELALQQFELRDQFRYGTALALGGFAPWLNLGVEGAMATRRDLWWQLGAGSGSWTFDGSKDDIDFEIDGQAKGLFGGSRLYASEAVPLYFGATLGYLYWKGSINPSGARTSEAAANSSVLRSGFTAHGPSLGVSLGLTSIWENGFYIDYSVVGFGQAFLFSQDVTAEGDTAGDVLSDNLTSAISWGLINIKLGYMFR